MAICERCGKKLGFLGSYEFKGEYYCKQCWKLELYELGSKAIAGDVSAMNELLALDENLPLISTFRNDIFTDKIWPLIIRALREGSLDQSIKAGLITALIK